MTTVINGQTYYRTREVCQIAGISRATLFRWVKVGILEDALHTDRNGWRLFTEGDINRIKTEATRVNRGGKILGKTRQMAR